MSKMMVHETVQTSDEVDSATSEYIIDIVNRLLLVADELDCVAKKIPKDMQDDTKVKQGLQYIFIVKEALSGFAKFLGSPIGKGTANIVWTYFRKHMNEVRGLVEIAATLTIATFIVVFGQEMIDVDEGKFTILKASIVECIHEQQNKIQHIGTLVNNAAVMLQRIGRKEYQDAAQLKILLWDFGECIRDAKIEIGECKSDLVEVYKTIEDAIAILKARVVLHTIFKGVCTGVLLTVFGMTVLVKKTSVGITISGAVIAAATAAMAFSTKPPRSLKYLDDFQEMKTTVEKLKAVLLKMENRLKSHEDKFNDETKNVPCDDN